MRKLLLLAVIATLAVGCNQTASNGPVAADGPDLSVDLGLKPHPDQTQEFTETQLLDLFANVENFGFLKTAKNGEFYFIEPTDGFKRQIADYNRTSEPVQLTPEQTEHIKETLSDARHYGWVAARKGCIPSPGIVLRLVGDQREMSVVFCFACNLLVFYESGTKLGGEDFDMMRPQFVTVLKALYPKNDLVQGLPLNGCGLTDRN